MTNTHPHYQTSNVSSEVYEFAQHYELNLNQDPLMRLESMLQAFTKMPYENLSKVIKWNAHKSTSRSKRTPEEVIRDHLRYNTGGTCFELTSTLLYMIRFVGFKAEPILADRPYGQNTHCAMVIEVDGKWHLVDPGFLILKPLCLTKEPNIEVKTCFNDLVLSGHADNDHIDLFTRWKTQCTYRLTYKAKPADPAEFLSAWDSSFYWDMMRYPLLTKTMNHTQIYMRKNHLQNRSRTSVESLDLHAGNTTEEIISRFGIHKSIVFKALQLFEKVK
ncbi:MAG: arylamine N-acetyltransferase [Chlamydiota bacterium]|nr:arylamine N-acetyltransferase [Chlamydiota bacterium]